MKKMLLLILTMILAFQSAIVFGQSENISQNLNYDNSMKTLMIDGEIATVKQVCKNGKKTTVVNMNGESDSVTFDKNTNKLYVNGKFHSKVKKAEKKFNLNIKKDRTSKNSWKYIGTNKFKLKFVGTETKAIIIGMVASVMTGNIPTAALTGLSILVGVSGFCSFKEKFYRRNTSGYIQFQKAKLEVYSDRSWDEHVLTIVDHSVI